MPKGMPSPIVDYHVWYSIYQGRGAGAKGTQFKPGKTKFRTETDSDKDLDKFISELKGSIIHSHSRKDPATGRPDGSIKPSQVILTRIACQNPENGRLFDVVDLSESEVNEAKDVTKWNTDIDDTGQPDPPERDVLEQVPKSILQEIVDAYDLSEEIKPRQSEAKLRAALIQLFYPEE